MNRLWLNGSPIEVKADKLGRPLEFVWKRQRHQVQQITRRWRTDQEWWRGRIWREYFKLTTKTGLLIVIFRDLNGGQWFLQRLYD
jgi:hypothetical protein